MSKWNIVFLVFIFLLGAIGIVYAAYSLNVSSVAAKSYARKQDELVKAHKAAEDIMKLENLPALEVKSNVLLDDISEHWPNCQPISVTDVNDKYTGIEFTLDLEQASPMKVDGTFYAFDQRPFNKGGCFLGRFKVSMVQGARVSASSIDILTGDERQQLEKSLQATQAGAPADASGDAADASDPTQFGWTMYLKCPSSSFYLLGTLSKEEREMVFQNFPAELRTTYEEYIAKLEEYEKDPDPKGDMPKAAEDFVYDFSTFLNSAYRERIENAVTTAELESQLKDSEKAKEEADAYLNALQNEHTKLTEDNKLMEAQRDEVKQLHDAMVQEIANLKKKIQDTQKKNENMVQKIQEYQQRSVSQSTPAAHF